MRLCSPRYGQEPVARTPPKWWERANDTARFPPVRLWRRLAFSLFRSNRRVPDPSERAIIRACEGQPHFAHLICLTAGEFAVQDDRSRIELADIDRSVHDIVKSHVLAAQYDRATKSTKPNALYRHVLAACALAEKSAVGEFRAKDVESPMRRIMGVRYEMAGFFRHLNAFTRIERGCVLTMDDRYYTFADPQMQPFAIFAAIDSGVINQELKEELFSAAPKLPFDDFL